MVAKNRNLTEEYFTSYFIKGLKEQIKNDIKIFRPHVSARVVLLANKEEVKLWKRWDLI